MGRAASTGRALQPGLRLPCRRRATHGEAAGDGKRQRGRRHGRMRGVRGDAWGDASPRLEGAIVIRVTVQQCGAASGARRRGRWS